MNSIAFNDGINFSNHILEFVLETLNLIANIISGSAHKRQAVK